MYAVRKAALSPLIQFNYTMPFDNSIMANTYLLIPHAEGVPNINSRNYHFGVCYQGDTFSDVYTDRPGQNKP
jgi:hypothetical protein